MSELLILNPSLMSENRRLAAVLFSDICGYTKLMAENESTALEMLKKNRAIHKGNIEAYGGHYVKEIGDGTLIWFDSSSDAVKFAMHVLIASKEHGYKLRFGIHEGDTIMESDDIFGNSVNIASRIEKAAVPGSILYSAKIFDSVKNQPTLRGHLLGQFYLKNDVQPRSLYALAASPCVVPISRDVRARRLHSFSLRAFISAFASIFTPRKWNLVNTRRKPLPSIQPRLAIEQESLHLAS